MRSLFSQTLPHPVLLPAWSNLAQESVKHETAEGKVPERRVIEIDCLAQPKGETP